MAGREFYAVSIDLFHNFTSKTAIKIHGIITGLDQGERQVVLTAISEWEQSKSEKNFDHK